MKFLLVVIISISLTSCFPGGEFFKQEGIPTEGALTVGVAVVDDATTAQVDPSSGLTQVIEVPEGASLEGTAFVWQAKTTFYRSSTTFALAVFHAL